MPSKTIFEDADLGEDNLILAGKTRRKNTGEYKVNEESLYIGKEDPYMRNGRGVGVVRRDSRNASLKYVSLPRGTGKRKDGALVVRSRGGFGNQNLKDRRAGRNVPWRKMSSQNHQIQAGRLHFFVLNILALFISF